MCYKPHDRRGGEVFFPGPSTSVWKLERVEVQVPSAKWKLEPAPTRYSGFRFPLAVPQTLRQREEGLAVPFVMLDSQALAVSRLLPNLPPCRACAMRCCQRASAVATDWQACCV